MDEAQQRLRSRSSMLPKFQGGTKKCYGATKRGLQGSKCTGHSAPPPPTQMETPKAANTGDRSGPQCARSTLGPVVCSSSQRASGRVPTTVGDGERAEWGRWVAVWSLGAPFGPRGTCRCALPYVHPRCICADAYHPPTVPPAGPTLASSPDHSMPEPMRSGAHPEG